jgi:hypothetical protein
VDGSVLAGSWTDPQTADCAGIICAVSVGIGKGSTVAIRSVVAVDEPSSGLQIQELTAGTWHTLSLSGELDLASKPVLTGAIERIDLSAPEGIVLGSRQVQRVFSLCGLLDSLPFLDV